MVEPQPSKLIMWVRFPSPAPEGGERIEGNRQQMGTPDAGAQNFRDPQSASCCLVAHIAQEVEHFLGKEEVTVSIPVVGSRLEKIDV